jgi:hypothetical protein
MSSWLADYEAWMALEESEKHRLISDANDARLTVEATQEVMHEMALERYNGWLAVHIVVVRNAVYQHARQVIRRGEVDQALVDLDEANLDMANTYYKIAGVNVTLCKYELAGFNFRACLDIQIKVLGANNMDVSSTWMALEECEKHRRAKEEASIRAGASIRANHAMDEFDKLIVSPLQFGGLP